MEVKVKGWMSGDPIAIDGLASAADALELMIDRGIRHLPVIDGSRRVVGILSIEDLRAALPFPVSRSAVPSVAERQIAREWCVSDVMTYAPETVREETPLAEAAQKLADRRIGCLPVVSGNGTLCGILSETDVLNALATTLWSDQVRERRGSSAPLEALVEELRRERDAIAARLEGYHRTERDLVEAMQDKAIDQPARGADQSDAIVTEQLDALAARRLDAIDRALEHAAQGHLATCDECDGTIPIGRLRALPGTTLCVACARAAEKRRD